MGVGRVQQAAAAAARRAAWWACYRWLPPHPAPAAAHITSLSAPACSFPAGHEFFSGGFNSSGCCGAVPLGRQAMTVGPSQPSSFFTDLSADLLSATDAKGESERDEEVQQVLPASGRRACRQPHPAALRRRPLAAASAPQARGHLRSRLPRAWWEAWNPRKQQRRVRGWLTTRPPGRSGAPPTEAEPGVQQGLPGATCAAPRRAAEEQPAGSEHGAPALPNQPLDRAAAWRAARACVAAAGRPCGPHPNKH